MWKILRNPQKVTIISTGKVTRYKINIQKSITFLYISNKQLGNEIKKSFIYIHNSIKKNNMPENLVI